jgi:hypothetical protein
LRNELTLERLASIHPVKPRFDALKKEAADLDTQIKQLTDALDNLLRMQQRLVTYLYYFSILNSKGKLKKKTLIFLKPSLLMKFIRHAFCFLACFLHHLSLSLFHWKKNCIC